MLEADIEKTQGAFTLRAKLSTGSGTVTALFGPSGAGKSTLANCLAGLIDPDAGTIALDGEVLFDAVKRIRVAPERRRIGYVFQDARLFPHMSVADNLRYGLRRTAAADRRVAMDKVVALLDIGALLGRAPGSLSGGERQRVAFGRAVLTSPKLLIMDEPLASLDAPRKAEILPFIERLRDELAIPMVYVSHAIDEILRLADQVVVLGAGRVLRAGPTVETLNSEPIVHGDLGDPGSVLEATVRTRDTGDRLTALDIGAAHLLIPAIPAPDGARVRLRIRARDVALATERPAHISVLNILDGRIDRMAPQEDGHIDVRLDIGKGVALWARITKRSAVELDLAEGKTVFALIKSVAIERGQADH